MLFSLKDYSRFVLPANNSNNYFNKDLIKNYLEGIEPLSSLLAKEDEIQNDGQWTAYYQWDERRNAPPTNNFIK